MNDDHPRILGTVNVKRVMRLDQTILTLTITADGPCIIRPDFKELLAAEVARLLGELR